MREKNLILLACLDNTQLQDKKLIAFKFTAEINSFKPEDFLLH